MTLSVVFYIKNHSICETHFKLSNNARLTFHVKNAILQFQKVHTIDAVLIFKFTISIR